MSAPHSAECLCGCNYDDRLQHGIHALQLIRRNPRPAFRRLFVPPVNPMELQALANLAGDLPVVREEGATALFIKFITEGYETVTEDESIVSVPPWFMPLLGLANISYSIVTGPSTAHDERDIQQIKDAYRSILDVVWRDLAALLPPGQAGDMIRDGVAQFLGLCSQDAIGLKQSMLDRPSLSVIMHCWIYTTRERRPRICPFILRMFSQASDQTLDMAVRSVTVDSLVSKFRDWLGDVELLDDELASDLRSLGPFLCARRPFVRAFLAAKTYEHVISALVREGRAGNKVQKCGVYQEGDWLLSYMSGSAPDSVQMLTDMLGAGLLDAMSELICMAAEQKKDLPQILRALLHVASCTDPSCTRPRTPQYILACRTALLPTYLPTLARLRAIKNEDYLAAWTDFAELVGLTAEACRREGAKECGNPACPNTSRKGEGGEGRSMKRCARCRRTAYCSPGCQKADWKVHKTKCQATATA